MLSLFYSFTKSHYSRSAGRAIAVLDLLIELFLVYLLYIK